jgi:hypothetical protein
MTKLALLLLLGLGVAASADARVDASTSRSIAPTVDARPIVEPSQARVVAAAPVRASTAPWSIAGPSSFAVGAWTLAALGYMRWRRRRSLAESAL